MGWFNCVTAFRTTPNDLRSLTESLLSEMALPAAKRLPGELVGRESRYDFNVALKAWINLEGTGKLAAESCHFDGLAGA